MITSLIKIIDGQYELIDSFSNNATVKKKDGSFISETDFIITSIFFHYKFSKECPLANISYYIKNLRPYWLSDDAIRKTSIYVKYQKVFDEFILETKPPVAQSHSYINDPIHWGATTSTTNTLQFVFQNHIIAGYTNNQ